MKDPLVIDRIPAEAFPLGEFLKDELAALGWTVADVSVRCSLSRVRIMAILEGDRMTLAESVLLALAFGVSPVLLLNLQTAYWKWKEAKP